MTRRIRDRRAFDRLHREGTRVRSGPLWCQMLLDPSLSEAHVAYALGRRVGGAVRRNRLRRQLRALVREAGPRVRPGWYLIGASPGATQLSSRDLHRHVERLVSRVESAT